ncbi:extensin [Streptomyces sp. NPDC059402]|uniref:extensin n=1 Tax=Streptomyces sp. NPDC059402 TaxID=3346822 RepID=UPI003682A6C4
MPAAPAAPAVTAASAAPGDASALPVQRAFGRGSRAGRTTGALASSAAAALAETLTRLRPHSSSQGPAEPPPPPYSAPPPGGPPPYSAVPAGPNPGEGQRPPEYTAVPDGGFDPRQLTEFQLDELVHRIVGRVTRLVRTELRMDRERIGRLRDPR